MKKSILVVCILSICLLSAVSVLTGAQQHQYAELIKKLLPTEVSTDRTYGYTKENPIKVGGYRENVGPLSERLYLFALRSPAGERIRFNRRGSCCPFRTPNGFNGTGLLDMYEITYTGLTTPVILYINMYDYEPTKVPVGFAMIKRRQNSQN